MRQSGNITRVASFCEWSVIPAGDEDARPKVKAARAALGLPEDDATRPVNVMRVQWPG